MRSFFLLTFAGILTLFSCQSLTAQTTQTVVRQEIVAIPMERRVINESTKFIDKRTGNPVSYQAYLELMRTDRQGYFLESIIDEYGKVSSYSIRPTTTEERETRRFMPFDPALRPKVGEPMPEFVMQGFDDKSYRLSTLKGRVVVLSFWAGLKPPTWNAKQAAAFADALQPYQSEMGPVALGVVRDSKEEVAAAMASQPIPFVAIPSAYNFSQKFHVTMWPSMFVINKAGNVVAYLAGRDAFEQLPKALEAANR
ncbi:TlpA disulfide reductase family protein [Fibrella sp. ES10-3-2-2]